MSSEQVTRLSVEIAGSEISFETGRMAKQASGAVVVRQGDTMVLATATAGAQREADFLPLTVDLEERMYAPGKIPGSFFKGEGRSGEKATLTARMIDRPLRPLFPKGWNYETQLIAMPISVDHVHPYDILAMNGASAALMISEIPFNGPVGAVRIGKIEGNFVINPSEEDLTPSLIKGQTAGKPRSELDLVVAGSEEAILMVEAGAQEVSEAEILDALDIAHAEIKKLCALQRELAALVGKEKLVVEPPVVDEALAAEILSSHGQELDRATQVVEKLERQEATEQVREAVLAHYAPEPPPNATAEELVAYEERRKAVELAFNHLEKKLIRERIAVAKKRPDGRSAEEIRPISIEIDVAPRTHGSALFTRGQTQALSVVALGTLRDEMRIDTLSLQTRKYYFHHYNFPPFSVAETGRLGPKRRDVGHGALAERALLPMVPTIDEFPYTIRVVSDILESNGSSSMASVCGSSLALMAAGVPIKRPVAGIAMGLIKEGDDYMILTDIAGDVDFKVAGTQRGITALQMDIKISGVTFEILRDALAQAKRAREEILAKMAAVIDRPRAQLAPHAPRIQTIQIDPSQIGLLIGKGGETIRQLCEEYEAEIDVADDGTVLIYSANGQKAQELVDRIRMMVKEVEVGDEFTGKVVKTTAFGAFVELTKGTDGLLHISNIAPGEKVRSVEDVLRRGDEVQVRVVEVDRERGRIGLRLASDPEIAGLSNEELAAVGTGARKVEQGRWEAGARDGGEGRRRRRRPGGRERR